MIASAALILFAIIKGTQPQVLYDAGAYVDVWLDNNGNGGKEDREPYMEGVCVWASYFYNLPIQSTWQNICSSTYSLTDKKGHFSAFFPGGHCYDILILVHPPQGYSPTTATIVNDCGAQFGLIMDPYAIEDNSIGIPPLVLEVEKRDRDEKQLIVIKFIIIGSFIMTLSGIITATLLKRKSQTN